MQERNGTYMLHKNVLTVLWEESEILQIMGYTKPLVKSIRYIHKVSFVVTIQGTRDSIYIARVFARFFVWIMDIHTSRGYLI